MKAENLKPNKILRGPIFSASVQTIVATSMGESVKIVRRNLLSGKVVDEILTPTQRAGVTSSPDVQPFDGDLQHFMLAVEFKEDATPYHT